MKGNFALMWAGNGESREDALPRVGRNAKKNHVEIERLNGT